MFHDIATMYWKECKEIFPRGSKQIVLFLVAVAVTGVWFPYQAGRSWLSLSLVAIVALVITPAFLSSSLVADSFAGERERHTLETLLATRLSDASIVLGKIAALLTVSTGITVASLLLGLIVANIYPAGYAWSFYPLGNVLLTLLLSVSFSVLLLGLGILVSLRASTVRQAQQVLNFGMLGLAFAMSLLASQRSHLSFLQKMQDINESTIFAFITGTFMLIDVVLLLLILTRFRRSRLILS